MCDVLRLLLIFFFVLELSSTSGCTPKSPQQETEENGQSKVESKVAVNNLSEHDKPRANDTQRANDSAEESPQEKTEVKTSERVSHIKKNVSIVFSKPEYSFTVVQAAKGIAIEYEIVVAQDIAGIVPLPQGSAGMGISVATTDAEKEIPGAFIQFETLTGGKHSYGIFDSGLPPPREVPPITIAEGSYPHTFEWDGRNWDGGSDTSNPKGVPFPPGVYTLEVSCAGIAVTQGSQGRFRIVKQVKVRLTK
jgi:hypothetical protein